MKIDNVTFDVALARCQKNNKGIAAELGVTPGAIHFMRYKTKNLRPETAGKLAQALGVDVCDIIERSEDSVLAPLPAPPAPTPTAPLPAPVAATPRKRKAEITPEQQAGFDRFWEEYPKKTYRDAALLVWVEINPDGSQTDKIVAAVKSWKASQWQNTAQRYIPAADKWMQKGGWRDTIKKDDSMAMALDMLMNTKKITNEGKMEVKL